MAMEVGVSSIPVSEVSSHHHGLKARPLTYPRKFYCDEHRSIGEAYARFAFCKDVDTLRAAAERLKSLTKYFKKRD